METENRPFPTLAITEDELLSLDRFRFHARASSFDAGHIAHRLGVTPTASVLRADSDPLILCQRAAEKPLCRLGSRALLAAGLRRGHEAHHPGQVPAGCVPTPVTSVQLSPPTASTPSGPHCAPSARASSTGAPRRVRPSDSRLRASVRTSRIGDPQSLEIGFFFRRSALLTSLMAWRSLARAFLSSL